MGVLGRHSKLFAFWAAVTRNARWASASTANRNLRIRSSLWFRSLRNFPHRSHSIHRSHASRRWSRRLPSAFSKYGSRFLRPGQRRLDNRRWSGCINNHSQYIVGLGGGTAREHSGVIVRSGCFRFQRFSRFKNGRCKCWIRQYGVSGRRWKRCVEFSV